MCFESIRAADIFRYHSHGKGILVDVREPEEYRNGHIPGAINLPYSELKGRIPELKAMTGTPYPRRRIVPVILYCNRGNTSLLAARDLLREGFCIKNVYGGIQSYRGPLVKGCK